MEQKELETILDRILTRIPSSAKKADLEHFLANVKLINKRMTGQQLTEKETTYQDHPLISHWVGTGDKAALETLESRLALIDRYEISDPQRIMDSLTCTFEDYSTLKLTPRMVKILNEYYQNPLASKSQIATTLGISFRSLSKDITSLRTYFSFRIAGLEDPQKFKLTQFIVHFRTKSLNHSESLSELFRTRRPRFLRTLSFDEDYRRGYLGYQIPDQPKGLKFFHKRIEMLQNEFFDTCQILKGIGAQVSMSFDAYEPSSGSWLLDPNIVSEGILYFTKRHGDLLPEPLEFKFESPLQFDQVDYLLALLAGIILRPSNFEWKQDMLKQFGFKLSKKTIWAREQRLLKEKAFFPYAYFVAPSFEEFIILSVQCSPEALNFVKLIPTLLPYAFVLFTDVGCEISFQRPIWCSSITQQLVRVISREKGVENIEVLRKAENIGSHAFLDATTRWQESRQQWKVVEDDI